MAVSIGRFVNRRFNKKSPRLMWLEALYLDLIPIRDRLHHLVGLRDQGLAVPARQVPALSMTISKSGCR